MDMTSLLLQLAESHEDIVVQETWDLSSNRHSSLLDETWQSIYEDRLGFVYQQVYSHIGSS